MGLAAGYMAESCEQRGFCGIQYVIEADGSVYPCDFFVMDDFYLGNLNKDSIKIVDENRVKIDFIQKSQELCTDCQNCEYYRLCRGGCMRNRDLLETEGKYKSFFCEGFKYFFDRCCGMLMVLGARVMNR